MNDRLVLLIDGSSFVFRAFHAIPNLTSPQGKPTGATYGIINMIKLLQKTYPTSHIGCVFDTTGKTFRDHIHPTYKANRKETPPELISQLNDIYALISALGLPVLMSNGIEADDIIGTLAKMAKQDGYKVIIASGDKDFAQLVDTDITLVNTMSNETLDIKGVINKFGVKPSQMIDYLTLVGDKVDNIAGVNKCGPKTAVKWIQEYDNLDNMILNKDQLQGIAGYNFRQSLNWLATAKTLITIDTNVDTTLLLPDGLDSLIIQPKKIDILIHYFTILGFKTWLTQLKGEKTPTVTEIFDQYPTKQSHQITDIDELEKIIDKITADNLIISLLAIPDNFACPTTLIYIAFNDANTTYFMQLIKPVEDLFAKNTHTILNYRPALYKLFAGEIPKILANYKDTQHILTALGFKLNGVRGDLTIAHYIKDSNSKHNLSDIYKDMLDIEVIDIPNNLSKINKNSIWYTYQSNSVTQDKIAQSVNQIVTHCIYLEKQIRQSMSSLEYKLYSEIELPLVNVLVNMENAGVKLDISLFKSLQNELGSQIKVLEDKIFHEAGCTFNLNSPKQLQQVLFQQLKLPVLNIKKNHSGFSTDEDSLIILKASGAKIADYLLEYRTLNKLTNTYISKLPLLVDKNQKLHTTYEQTTVVSGRLSSREPNLQNIPIRNEWGRKIRHAFIADDTEHVLVCADYSQIELRILAHISQDENLIQAFNDDIDIHAITASEIFHKSIVDVTSSERRYAKSINFGLIYGKTVFGLAQELGIEKPVAKAYIDAYFAKYPKIKSCLEHIKTCARENGYIETTFGRKIYLPNINANNKIMREAEERLALNAPMQGTSADIIKIAMNNIADYISTNKLLTQIIMQIHDELILLVPNKEKDIIVNNLQKLMTMGTNLKVKLKVDIKVAQNWDEAH